MPYHPHTLLTFGGSMGSGSNAETWQCGIRLAQKPPAGDFEQLDDLTAYGNSISGGLTTVFHTPTGANTGGGWPASWAHLDWLKVANIGADGKYQGVVDNAGGPNPFKLALSGAAGPSSGTAAMPWFTTIAVSFRTDAPGKYGLHGRIYPPMGVESAGSGSPRLLAADVTAAGSWGTQLLTAISKPTPPGANSAPIRPVVASDHAGEIFLITSVRIGDVMDVQRRRKKALREVYTSTAWS